MIPGRNGGGADVGVHLRDGGVEKRLNIAQGVDASFDASPLLRLR